MALLLFTGDNLFSIIVLLKMKCLHLYDWTPVFIELGMLVNASKPNNLILLGSLWYEAAQTFFLFLGGRGGGGGGAVDM